ncbi:MAG: biotin--[acetyl-CoA-carboxylase] ligase [Massiliimalia sp.]|jgi:BirA family biotin operon repressor/biotin-[acetyl-CoA-carboxylase] ligase
MASTKQQVFEFLCKADGGFVSGGGISEHLGISRTAVWKAIQSLRQEGCQIEAVPNQGYRLLPSDEFSPLELRRKLSTKVLGKELIFLEEVSSTNEYLKSHMELPAGTIVFAQRQTSGKGKAKILFASPEGEGLYFSILLRPSMMFDQVGALREQIMTGISQTINQVCGIALELEVPNRLLWNGKKVSGILMEVSVESESGMVESVIAGIGIYVNCTFPEQETECDSLNRICGKTVNRLDLASQLIQDLDRRIIELFGQA